jgi:hypothetical protein
MRAFAKPLTESQHSESRSGRTTLRRLCDRAHDHLGFPRRLLRAIANIEIVKRATVPTGDHILVVGEVLKFGVNQANRERPLVSLGPRTDGFEVLAHERMHRLGVVRTV